ncbi:hypothetical protein CBR_g31518 [Chara braunii]|uniref:GPI-anchored protein LLG1-like domain-containing protein n=1 Tax=Chara braunii TaxID=69332 RepID=A0A388LF88_CHABU|nr:hypothetical protein CBR_g31518 [Chara braunii]|eukprot:GBG80961.1 hypothetical protein CBR_g31518 [Chara braunii]
MELRCWRRVLLLLLVLSAGSFAWATRTWVRETGNEGRSESVARECADKIASIDYSTLARACRGAFNELCCKTFESVVEPFIDDVNLSVMCVDVLLAELERRSYSVALIDAICQEERRGLLATDTSNAPSSETLPAETKTPQMTTAEPDFALVNAGESETSVSEETQPAEELPSASAPAAPSSMACSLYHFRLSSFLLVILHLAVGLLLVSLTG